MKHLLIFLFGIFLLFSSSSPDFAQYTTSSLAEEQDYTFASGLFKDQLYQLAFQQFEQFIEKYPASLRRPDAEFLAAECLFFESRYEEAARRYQLFIREYPSNSLHGDALFRLGESYFHVGRYSEAKEALKTVLDRFGDRPFAGEAAYWIGQCALREGDNLTAVKYLSMAVEQYPSNPIVDYALYSLGWLRQKQTNYPLAIQSYEQLALSYPKSALVGPARIREAECLLALGKYKEATELLDAAYPALTDSADIAAALFAMGEAHYGAKKYNEACAAYLQFLKQFPDSPHAFNAKYSLAWTYRKINDIEQAVSMFEELVSELQRTKGNDTLLLHAAYDEATILIDAKRFDAAKKPLNLILRHFSQSKLAGNALYQLGVIAFNTGAYEQAQMYFDELTAKHPESDLYAKALWMLGETHFAKGDLVEAAERYSDVLNLQDVTKDIRSNSLFQRGWIFYKLGRYSSATKDFSDYLSEFPHGVHAEDAEYWLAESQYASNSFTEAVESYREYLTGYPMGKHREDALYGLGYSLFQAREFSEAARTFEQFLKDFPGSRYQADATLRLADSYFYAKEFHLASGAYRAVIRLYSDKEDARYAQYQLGYALYRAGDVQGAIACFLEIVTKFATSRYAPDAQYMIGWIYFQDRNYRSAISEFKKVLEHFPQSAIAARAQYSIGDAYYNLRDYNNAIQAYNEVIKKFPTSPYISDAVDGIQFAYALQGNSAGAITTIEHALKEAPPDAAEVLLLKKGEMLFNQKQLTLAEQTYREFLSRYPSSTNVSQANFFLGRALMAKGDTSAAMQAFLVAYGHDLEDSAVHPSSWGTQAALSLGAIAGSRHQMAEAARWYDRAASIAKMPEVRSKALYEKAKMLLEIGDSAEAIALLKDISRSDSPFSARSQIALARIHIERKQFDRATRMLESIAASRADSLGAEAQFLIGETLKAAGRDQEAISAYLRVKYVFAPETAWVARALLKAADCYRSLGLLQRARALLEEVSKTHEADRFGAEAKDKLRQLQ